MRGEPIPLALMSLTDHRDYMSVTTAKLMTSDYGKPRGPMAEVPGEARHTSSPAERDFPCA